MTNGEKIQEIFFGWETMDGQQKQDAQAKFSEFFRTLNGQEKLAAQKEYKALWDGNGGSDTWVYQSDVLANQV